VFKLVSKKEIFGTDVAKLRLEPNTSWHVVYTKPRSEKKVYERFLAAGLEAYCPLHKSKRKWSDRWKWVEEPIFKSYCFVKANGSIQNQVRQIPGVVNFVYWLRKPAILRDNEILELKELFNKHELREIIHKNLEVGQEVIVGRGVLKNNLAIIKKVFKKTITVYLPAIKFKIVLNKTDILL
jgi:transcription antitermination factor NusG